MKGKNMSIFKHVKAEQLQARKNKEKVKTDLFTTLIGSVQTVAKNTKQDSDNPPDELVLSQVKAFINGAEESLRMNPALITPVLELEYLKALLPQQLSAEKLKEVVDQILATVDASVTSGKLVGVVMGQLKKDYPNQFDASLVRTFLP